ncbi:MAG: hypothetical protein A2Z14_01425 [Chloroflexi bacterium RBG_16_48_8]|nr:MAG: hypothetical protein A2Z14_01425 [Chloroflexi bacterium RBG_16_48_8]
MVIWYKADVSKGMRDKNLFKIGSFILYSWKEVAFHVVALWKEKMQYFGINPLINRLVEMEERMTSFNRALPAIPLK